MGGWNTKQKLYEQREAEGLERKEEATEGVGLKQVNEPTWNRFTERGR